MIETEAHIGISISEPSDEELWARGLTADHVRHAFIEIARQILAAGDGLAFGGDLRAGGYTHTLIALLRTYSRTDRPDIARVRQYLSRPVWEAMDAQTTSQVAPLLTLVRVDGPEARDDVSRAQATQAMRAHMAKEITARVALGGRLQGQRSRWPGVAEEVALAIEAEQPVYLLGGLGGAAARVASAIQGDWPDELTTGFQLEHSELHQALGEAGVGLDEDRLRSVLPGASLNNGLGEAENALLLETADLDLMVALVLRGLRNLRPSQRSAEESALRDPDSTDLNFEVADS